MTATAAPESPGPIRITVDDCELVQAGLASMLAPYAERVSVLHPGSETGADVVLAGEPAQTRSADGSGVRLSYTWDGASSPNGLSKYLSADELVQALERIVGAGSVNEAPFERPNGLSEREADILALVGCGLSNDQVASRLYLSINTVKSYIRSAYRKIGVSRRTQAVLWVSAHPLPRPETH